MRSDGIGDLSVVAECAADGHFMYVLSHLNIESDTSCSYVVQCNFLKIVALAMT